MQSLLWEKKIFIDVRKRFFVFMIQKMSLIYAKVLQK